MHFVRIFGIHQLSLSQRVKSHSLPIMSKRGGGHHSFKNICLSEETLLYACIHCQKLAHSAVADSNEHFQEHRNHCVCTSDKFGFLSQNIFPMSRHLFT